MKEKNQRNNSEDIIKSFDGSVAENGGKKAAAEKDGKKKGKLRTKFANAKKWQKALIIIAIVLVALILIATIAFFSIRWWWNKKYIKPLDVTKLGVTDDIYKKYGDTDEINVLVFGVDSRDPDSFKGLSDTIMIVSINPKNKSVKITSILRDSYVQIDGHGRNKINAAYSWGGPELAINTVNQNFRMNITDYATINMWKMAEAIDVLGGVDVEITKSEMEQINSEATGGTQKGVELVKSYGKVHLNGGQATIFCRLRKQDSDVRRSDRQKEVIWALLAQARKVDPSKYSDVVKTMLNLCETSVDFDTIMKFVPLIRENVTIETLTVPGEADHAFGGAVKNYNGSLIPHSSSDMWVWIYDLNAASNRIHEFIYGAVPEGKANVSGSDATKQNPSSSSSSTATTTRPASKSGSGSSASSGSPASQPTTAVSDSAETTTLSQGGEVTAPEQISEPATQQETQPAVQEPESVTQQSDGQPEQDSADEAA